MRPMRRKRVIRRLEKRILKLEGALSLYDQGGDEEVRGRLVTWVLNQLDEQGVEIDTDDDGRISVEEFEDAVEELQELLDKKVKLPEPWDGLVNLGVALGAHLIMAIVMRQRTRLERRLARKQGRLETLRLEEQG